MVMEFLNPADISDDDDSEEIEGEVTGICALNVLSHARSKLIYGQQGRLIPEAMEDEHDMVKGNQDLNGGDGEHHGDSGESGW